jgi:hypothetical protein
MSASLNLHSADGNSVEVRNFSADKDSAGFTSVSIFDYEKNAQAVLFFANPSQVLNFALLLKEQVSKLGTLYTEENLKN